MAKKPRLVDSADASVFPEFGQHKVRPPSESDYSVFRGTCNVLSTEVSRSGPSSTWANEKGADLVDTVQV